MNPGEYGRLLADAAMSEYGLRLQLTVSHVRDAMRVRRRLYLARERARASGDRSLDSLSVVLKRQKTSPAAWEVWIVRRDRLPGAPPPDDGIEPRADALMRDELPRDIRARGRGRRAFRFNPLHCAGPQT